MRRHVQTPDVVREIAKHLLCWSGERLLLEVVLVVRTDAIKNMLRNGQSDAAVFTYDARSRLTLHCVRDGLQETQVLREAIYVCLPK